MKIWDTVWTNGRIVTCEKGFGVIENGAIAIKNGKIAWVGESRDLPGNADMLANAVNDLNGKCLTPGLIDCHTHLIYAGNRANEFELRLKGASYAEIARQGGGIQSTVSATRVATEDELFQQSISRARALMSTGVTTIEIKSGYGLDLETELKMLRVAVRLEKELGIQIRKTFLGAHTVPKEYKEKPDDYIDMVCNEMLPRIAKENLSEAVDVFCETIAFNLHQTEKVFAKAQKLGLGIKCHAEQLTDSGSAVLAAKYKALSVDHLEHLSEAGVKAIAQSGTVAVLLPGAFYFLRETHLPPLALLRSHQVPMAIASDCNPGTSPITSLLIILNMACTLFRMTPEEAFLGVSINAAKALGIETSHGSLSLGKVADFAIWDVKHPIELIYNIGANPLIELIKSIS